MREWFKHDYDASDDERITNLRIKMGAAGYGIYWLIVEKIYRKGGRIDRDFKALAWEFREAEETVRAVVEDFGLFYVDSRKKVACKRVDRDLEARQEASVVGRESAIRRWARHRVPIGNPLGNPVDNYAEERRREEKRGGDKAPPAPLGFGVHAKDPIASVPPGYARWVLTKCEERHKLNALQIAALEDRAKACQDKSPPKPRRCATKGCGIHAEFGRDHCPVHPLVVD